MKKTALLFALLVMISTAACSTKPAPNTTTALPPQTEKQTVTNNGADSLATAGTATTAPEKQENTSHQQESQAAIGGGETIYFTYDSYLTSEEAKDSLVRTSELLKKKPELKLTIAGHCDERGSEMYNIALGEKRAQSAKNYLVTLGTDPERLETVSYGEERPAAKGSSEEAWALNRRVDFM